jgi:hypothetical protein
MPGAVNLAFPLIMGSAATGVYFILIKGKINSEITGETSSFSLSEYSESDI